MLDEEELLRRRVIIEGASKVPGIVFDEAALVLLLASTPCIRTQRNTQATKISGASPTFRKMFNMFVGQSSGLHPSVVYRGCYVLDG